MIPSRDAMREAIVAVLAGRSPAWPFGDDAPAADAFVATCRDEGLGPLVHFHLSRASADAWPAAVRAALADDARIHAAWDLLREREIASVLAAFGAGGIDALLLKGTPLAYTHYAEPALRTRTDTDVFIRHADRERAVAMLERKGYARVHGVAGELVSYQDSFHRRDAQIDHIVDLHWQINNGQVFAQALPFDEVRATAVPVPQLGTSARTLSPPHALLLACMHRAAHLALDGAESDRLLWLYDIDLLARAMQAVEWDAFAALCASKGMRAVSRAALERAQAVLGTTVPERVTTALAAPAPRELSAAYVDGTRRAILLTDLRALRGWRAKAALLREVALPRADYLLAKYRTERRWLLPWLYVRRVVEGIAKHGRS